MPFPSGGCQTCRARHIKCDETRPTCLNCRKSGRHCAGWRSGTGSMLFLNENIYASTQARRPRGGARWVPTFSADDVSTLDKHGRDRRTNSPATASDIVIHPASRSSTSLCHKSSEAVTWIPPCPKQPLEELALTHFARLYFRGQGQSPENMWTICRPFFGSSSKVSENVTLQLAFTALSLVHYGRMRGVSAAVVAGRKKYSQALQSVRNAIEDENIAVSDEVLISVMVMAGYENNVANFDREKLVPMSFQHHQGAMVLLKLRQEQRNSRCSPNSLDNCIRRQVIRGCIYHSTQVPRWLHDGLDFGEEEYQLGLDKSLIELASFRHRLASILYENEKPAQLPPEILRAYTESLIREAVQILNGISAWRMSLDPAHHFVLQHGSLPNPQQSSAVLFYSSEMNIYPSLPNAGMWGRYCGTRIWLHCILDKLLYFWRHVVGDDKTKYAATERMSRADVQLTANEICASVPYAFGVDFDTQKDMDTITEHALPARTYNLAWPLIVLSGAPCVNELQRQWVREKMLLVSKNTGNEMLELIANV